MAQRFAWVVLICIVWLTCGDCHNKWKSNIYSRNYNHQNNPIGLKRQSLVASLGGFSGGGGSVEVGTLGELLAALEGFVEMEAHRSQQAIQLSM